MLIKQIHHQDSKKTSAYEAFQTCVFKEILLAAEALLTAHWHNTESLRWRGLCKKELSEVGLSSTVLGYLPYLLPCPWFEDLEMSTSEYISIFHGWHHIIPSTTRQDKD